MQLATVEPRLAQVFDEAPRVPGGQLHVRQQGFIPPQRSAPLPGGCGGGAGSCGFARWRGDRPRRPRAFSSASFRWRKPARAGSAPGSNSISRSASLHCASKATPRAAEPTTSSRRTWKRWHRSAIVSLGADGGVHGRVRSWETPPPALGPLRGPSPQGDGEFWPGLSWSGRTEAWGRAGRPARWWRVEDWRAKTRRRRWCRGSSGPASATAP